MQASFAIARKHDPSLLYRVAMRLKYMSLLKNLSMRLRFLYSQGEKKTGLRRFDFGGILAHPPWLVTMARSQSAS